MFKKGQIVIYIGDIQPKLRGRKLKVENTACFGFNDRWFLQLEDKAWYPADNFRIAKINKIKRNLPEWF